MFECASQLALPLDYADSHLSLFSLLQADSKGQSIRPRTIILLLSILTEAVTSSSYEPLS